MRLPFAALAAALVVLAACPANHPPAPPPSPPPPTYVPPDAGSAAPIDLADAAPSPRALGASCVAAADCDSGVCEGQGCGDDAPGRCVDPKRICTMDLVDYCGCDGTSFKSSGTCAGRRYVGRGSCPAPTPPPKKVAGAACLSADECDSGVCEGKGCGDDTPGQCADTKKKCSKERRAFCGCDGKTFSASSTCTARRYAHAGKC